MDRLSIANFTQEIVRWGKDLWDRFMGYFTALHGYELALQILIFTVVFLFVLTVILAWSVLLLRVKNNWNARRYRRLENIWEARLMDLLSLDEGETAEPIRVQKRDQYFFLQYLYRFAARFRGQELALLKNIAQPYLPILVKRIKKGYPELRARNVNLLATLGFPEFIGPIIEALDDPAPIVKMSAARILAHPDYPEHIVIILPQLQSFDGWAMNFLASMLAELGPHAGPRLRAELKDPQVALRVRVASAEALRMIGNLKSANEAAQVLLSETNEELVAACLRLLKEVGTDRQKSAILTHLSSPSEIIRIHAVAALGSVGGAEDAPLFEAAFNDESRWVNLQAARSLQAIGSDERLHQFADSDHPNKSVAKQVLMEAGLSS